MTDLARKLIRIQALDAFQSRKTGDPDLKIGVDQVSVLPFESAGEAEAALRSALGEDSGRVRLWRNQPEDPWRRIRTDALTGRVKLQNPRVIDIEFARRKLKIFTESELAALVGNRADGERGGAALNFDQVWEREVDRKRRTFSLEEFRRESRLELQILEARRQLRQREYKAALANLERAKSSGGALPEDYHYLLGEAQVKTGKTSAGARNLARFARSASDRAFNYDNCLAMLSELKSSRTIASLPSDYRREVDSALKEAPVHFADIDTVGAFREKSPMDKGVEYEKEQLRNLKSSVGKISAVDGQIEIIDRNSALDFSYAVYLNGKRLGVAANLKGGRTRFDAKFEAGANVVELKFAGRNGAKDTRLVVSINSGEFEQEFFDDGSQRDFKWILEGIDK